MSEALSLEKYSPTRPQIEKVRYTHDAMIDLLIANPAISQNELAAHFGYTASWVSTIFASDAFQERMALRKEDLVDPTLRATVEERMRALVLQSIQVLQQKLEQPASAISAEVAVEVFKSASKALGYGARSVPVNIEKQYIVHVPQKDQSSQGWEKRVNTIDAEIVS